MRIARSSFQKAWWLAACAALSFAGQAAEPDIIFNKNFEAGALGKIQKLSDNEFRCYVEGQVDEHGRNRQANWYYFQMTHVNDRAITLILTDFVGEYNGRPGACPMTRDTMPVFSYDNVSWQHFPSMHWDDKAKEATLRFKPTADTIWIAHVHPYPHSRLLGLLHELDQAACVRTEVTGRTAQGRELHLVTVTNFDKPDAAKKTVWLIARQHAWETGTSYVMEGALRFVASDEPKARELRDHMVFKFTPMMDPDGCASGKVRFNANGYDVNRHWNEIDLRSKRFLEQMPEIWYTKKAILAYLDSGQRIDLLVNMHNDETTEYLDTEIAKPAERQPAERLLSLLRAQSSFDPTSDLKVNENPGPTTNCLYAERKIPVLTMEQMIGPSKKLGRQANVSDRLAFGPELISAMAESVEFR